MLAVFSFNGNKIITTSGGGHARLRRRGPDRRTRASSRTQARDPAPHYEHPELGFNYRLSNLLAALGRAQLEALRDRVVARRRRSTAATAELLSDEPGVAFMPEASYGTSNHWLTCVIVDPSAFGADREAIRIALETTDIEARPVWKPMHLQPVFAGDPIYGGDVSARLFERGLCLPSGSALTDDEQDRVVAGLRAAAGR